MTPPLPRGTKLWYGFGQLAEGLKNESFSLFLLFYYTQVVGLSGTLAGQAILISLLFDAMTDPLIGAVSDHTNTRLGRRHPYMYAAALPLAGCFYLVFVPPAGLSQFELFGWLVVTAVATRTAMTLFHVPHLALGAELSTNYAERTSIVATRYVFARSGHALAAVIGLLVFMRPTAGFPEGQLNPAAYPPFATTLAIAIGIIVLLTAGFTQSRVRHLAQRDPKASVAGALMSLLGDMWQTLHIRAFRALFFGSTLAFVAFGVTGALGLHLGTYFWKVSTDELLVWGVGAGIGLFTGLGFWNRAAQRLEKKAVFMQGLAVFTLFTTTPPLLKLLGWWPDPGSITYLAAFVLTTGVIAHFGIASTMVTGGSMMADVTDEDALIHGRYREGLFFGAVSFASKASFGVGSQIAGFVVDAVGLLPGARPGEVGPEVVTGLGLTLGGSVLVLVGLSIAVFSRYDLTRERHAQTRAALDAREPA